MMLEIAEGEQIIDILNAEMRTFEQLSAEMREFISKMVGNPIWERLVQARWLKQKQSTQRKEYDPDLELIPPVFVPS